MVLSFGYPLIFIYEKYFKEYDGKKSGTWNQIPVHLSAKQSPGLPL